MKGYVYILRDENCAYYVGSTIDVERRLKQHKYGHTRTTQRMNNPKLVLAQEYESIQLAQRVERQIKKLKRKDYLNKMIEDGVIRLLP